MMDAKQYLRSRGIEIGSEYTYSTDTWILFMEAYALSKSLTEQLDSINLKVLDTLPSEDEDDLIVGFV